MSGTIWFRPGCSVCCQNSRGYVEVLLRYVVESLLVGILHLRLPLTHKMVGVCDLDRAVGVVNLVDLAQPVGVVEQTKCTSSARGEFVSSEFTFKWESDRTNTNVSSHPVRAKRLLSLCKKYEAMLR